MEDVPYAHVRQKRWKMESTGTVANGVVVLDNGANVPDGTRVRVTVPAAEAAPPSASNEPTANWLLGLSGVIKDMPSDFAAQHEHYIHGMPKR